jgi:hypothetical protein
MPGQLALSDRDRLAGQHRRDVLDQGLGRQHVDVAVQEPLEQAALVDLRPVEHRQQRLDLGGEQDQAFGPGVVQRLDPEAVPDQGHGAGLAIVDGEREHADEAVGARKAPLHEGVQHHLGVGA